MYRTIVWLEPERCVPPHAVTSEEKVRQLMKGLEEFGWDGEALVGYTTWDRRERSYVPQLLSGSHRWEAARRLRMRLPVVMIPEREVEDAWGFPEQWKKLMRVGFDYEWLIRRYEST